MRISTYYIINNYSRKSILIAHAQALSTQVLKFLNCLCVGQINVRNVLIAAAVQMCALAI